MAELLKAAGRQTMWERAHPGWYQQTKERGTSYELYDLQNDPAETKNIAEQNPERVKQLSADCAAWQRRCGILDYGEILKMNSSSGN
jgi:hypothetical protein